MALQGTLDTVALADVTRLLATTAKTGRLRLDGGGPGGSLWFADGAVVGGDVEHGSAMPAEQALYELLRSEVDRFEFVPGDVVPEAGDPVDVDTMLAAAGERLDRWRALTAVVPSLDAAVTLAAELGPDEVVIDRDRWRLLTVAATGSSVRQLGVRLGLDELELCQSIGELLEAGLVELGGDVVAEAPAAPAPGDQAAVAAATPVEDEPVARPADAIGGDEVVGSHDVASDVGAANHRYLMGDGGHVGSRAAILSDFPEPLPGVTVASAARPAPADDGHDPFGHAPEDGEPPPPPPTPATRTWWGGSR